MHRVWCSDPFIFSPISLKTFVLPYLTQNVRLFPYISPSKNIPPSRRHTEIGAACLSQPPVPQSAERGHRTDGCLSDTLMRMLQHTHTTTLTYVDPQFQMLLTSVKELASLKQSSMYLMNPGLNNGMDTNCFVPLCTFHSPHISSNFC